MFTSDRREKQGWGTDYPGADINFSVRLAELTKVRVGMTHDGEEEVPDAVVVRLTTRRSSSVRSSSWRMRARRASARSS